MGYCDGVMDESLIHRYRKEYKKTVIFTYGRSYDSEKGTRYYGVKWNLQELEKYDSQSIFMTAEGKVDVYDDDEIEVVDSFLVDKFL